MPRIEAVLLLFQLVCFKVPNMVTFDVVERLWFELFATG